jgi:hypothetical protein
MVAGMLGPIRSGVYQSDDWTIPALLQQGCEHSLIPPRCGVPVSPSRSLWVGVGWLSVEVIFSF